MASSEFAVAVGGGRRGGGPRALEEGSPSRNASVLEGCPWWTRVPECELGDGRERETRCGLRTRCVSLFLLPAPSGKRPSSQVSAGRERHFAVKPFSLLVYQPKEHESQISTVKMRKET